MPTDRNIPISKAFETPAHDETPEVVGHGIRVSAGPERTKPEAEVEGHGVSSGRLMDVPVDGDDDSSGEASEVEGHGIRPIKRSADGDDETSGEAPEVEGHMPRVRFGPIEQAAEVEAPEVEGHGISGKFGVEQPSDDPKAEDDVEGRGARAGF